MLYYLLYEQLFKYVSPFRVFRYTTFRTAFASLTALFLCVVLGPWLIRKLREFQIGQYIREEGPKSHQKKAGHADHGRGADHHLDRDSDAAVGGPAQSLRLGRARSRCWASAGSASWTTTPRSRKRRNLGLTARRKLALPVLDGASCSRRCCC